jgi:hypothetical protein
MTSKYLESMREVPIVDPWMIEMTRGSERNLSQSMLLLVKGVQHDRDLGLSPRFAKLAGTAHSNTQHQPYRHQRFHGHWSGCTPGCLSQL